MTKLGNKVIKHWVLEQNPQFKQKLWTTYKNHKWEMCVAYLIKEFQFCFLFVAE